MNSRNLLKKHTIASDTGQEQFLDDPMPDVIAQWQFYLAALQPSFGHKIIDVGCSSGDAERLLVQNYPEIGKVIGVENNPNRYNQAMRQWQQDGSSEKIEFKLADAHNLPFADQEFDRALCVETLEWTTSPLTTLKEIHRVLKEDGSAVISHSDFDTQIFHARDKRLCRKIVQLFSDSGPNGQIGREIHSLCKQAGFSRVQPCVYTLINTKWHPNLYAYNIARIMIDDLTKKSLVAESEVEQWLLDLEAQALSGEFFYSINRYVCYCQK
jgi:ubiquinone/menaquinone biosynthesis C-methylase UbiE